MKFTTFADACLDPNLFGDWFGKDTWANWRVIDKAVFGLSLECWRACHLQEPDRPLHSPKDAG